MKKKRQLKKIRNLALANGPINTTVKGSPKGKKGYDRKDKRWKNDES